MLRSTLPLLTCPGLEEPCGGNLEIFSEKEIDLPQIQSPEIVSGELRCKTCRGRFPILRGVAIVVPDVAAYLYEHVRGISKLIDDREIPKPFQKDWGEAKEMLDHPQADDDLESDRVTALYVMNHFLRVHRGPTQWWKELSKESSPLLRELMEKHWDQGPLHEIQSRFREGQSLVELGCGSGGLLYELKNRAKSYLGVDSSFLSIAMGRHIVLGAEYPEWLGIPSDLLRGPVAQQIELPKFHAQNADLIVGDALLPPLKEEQWDVSVSLNLIDMLPRPEELPLIQAALVRKGGTVMGSSPYIWHSQTAETLRQHLPKNIKDSASAGEWLYERAGLKIIEKKRQIPWLFFKHLRQLEVYWTDLVVLQKE